MVGKPKDVGVGEDELSSSPLALAAMVDLLMVTIMSGILNKCL